MPRFLHDTRAPLTAILLMLCCGCGKKDAAHGDPSASAGVDNDQRGAWKSGDEWRLVPEVRIGSADGEGAGTFGNVVEVAIDEMGRTWVADAHQHQIQIFDRAGVHVRSVGRKGGGPGEFADIAGMAWAPDGRLWVLDGGNSRFAVFDTAGRLVTTHPRNSVVTSSPWPGRFDARDRLYDVDAEVRPDGSTLPVIVRSGPAGEPRDTFHLPQFRPDVFQIVSGDERNRRITEFTVPFSGRQAWTVDREGYVWVANTARYRLERYAFSGKAERVIERRGPSVPVTPEERDRMLENYRQFTQQGGKIDLSRIPDHHPDLTSFVFDDAGNLWVSPVAPPTETRMLDVFDVNARFLGHVALPAPRRASVRAIRGDRMAVIVRDSLDVPTVVVMRIQKQGR